MSMNGEYLRVTPAELDRALKDPEWAIAGAAHPATVPADAAVVAAELGL